MAGLLYAHRVAKLLDELVGELGLTMSLADGHADVDLAKSMDNIRLAAENSGVAMSVRNENGMTIVTFARKQR